MEGWNLKVGDLVAVDDGYPPAGALGLVLAVIVPRKQFQIFWMENNKLPPTAMWGYIKPVSLEAK